MRKDNASVKPGTVTGKLRKGASFVGAVLIPLRDKYLRPYVKKIRKMK